MSAMKTLFAFVAASCALAGCGRPAYAPSVVVAPAPPVIVVPGNRYYVRPSTTIVHTYPSYGSPRSYSGGFGRASSGGFGRSSPGSFGRSSGSFRRSGSFGR